MANLLSLLPPGPYAIWEPAAERIVETLSNIDLHVHMAEWNAEQKAGVDAASPNKKKTPYPVSDGVAVFSIDGPMSKAGASSLEDATSTVALRKQVRQAKADGDVKAAALKIDSPGGTVAGLHDLALDLKSFANEKPLYAYIEDMGASAAYYAACMCNAIYANSNAMVGCIGTVSSISDSSAMAEKLGVKVHILRSGEHKGMGTPGVPVTEANVAQMQSIVDTFANQFVSVVNRGRGLSLKAGGPLADGSVLVGHAARNAGLIDGVTSFDKVIDKLKNYSPA